MSSPQKLCQIAECQVATTGTCHLRNDPVESCPNYAQQDTTIDDVELLPEAGVVNAAPIDICSGDVMHLEDLETFVRANTVRTVSLIGEHRAGKTTLLASIYAMYCKGPFAGLSFAGSKTLVGFAKRHHLALLNSGRTNPKTPRTSRDDPAAFFHLALARAEGNPVHLVISDRSGEAYGDARTDTSLIQNLPELRQAERACFVLDGAKLANKTKRPAYARHFKQMIHALHDNGALKNAKVIEVLSTKLDLTKRGNSQEQLKFLAEYEQQISDQFRGRGLDIACHRICALPKADHTVGFVGLDDMIRRWVAPPPLVDVSPIPIKDSPRQIDRLLAKMSRDST
jgi:hypothetical protein